MPKIWLILAIVLIVFGLITFAVIMTIYGWDFGKLNSAKRVTNTHNITDIFHSICIDTETANIRIVPSVDGHCSVVCNEFDKLTHTVTVENGTLSVRLKDERAWYEHIGINFRSIAITISLPQDVYEALSIKLTTGDVSITDLQCKSLTTNGTTGDITLKNITVSENLSIKHTTGDVTITDLQCKTLTADGSTGDITLKNVIASEKLLIGCTTGDVRFDRCDAGEIFVDVTTGDIRGSLLSEKIFIAKTSTGDIRLPDSSTGGTCRVTTTTGDIHLEIK